MKFKDIHEQYSTFKISGLHQLRSIYVCLYVLSTLSTACYMYTVSALHKHALAFEIKKPDLKKSITNYLKYAIHTLKLCLYVLDYKY